MEVTSNNHIIKKEATSATISGIIAGSVVAGYEYYKQKNLLESPILIKKLRNDVLDSEKALKTKPKEKGIKNFLNCIMEFFDKRELGIKKNILQKISQNKISTKAIVKSAGIFAIDWAIASFAIERTLDIFRTKPNINLRNVKNNSNFMAVKSISK